MAMLVITRCYIYIYSKFQVLSWKIVKISSVAAVWNWNRVIREGWLRPSGSTWPCWEVFASSWWLASWYHCAERSYANPLGETVTWAAGAKKAVPYWCSWDLRPFNLIIRSTGSNINFGDSAHHLVCLDGCLRGKVWVYILYTIIHFPHLGFPFPIVGGCWWSIFSPPGLGTPREGPEAGWPTTSCWMIWSQGKRRWTELVAGE